MIAVDAADVSGAIVRLTCVPGLALSKFNVTSGIAPVTVFDALLIVIPFTVSDALAPVAPAVNPKVPDDATEKAPALPDVLLTSASLDPLESVTMLAVTPAPAALIAAAKSERVFTPLPVVMVVAVPPLGVMVMVPAPKSVVEVATAFEAYDAVVARLLTCTTVVPVAAPAVTVAVATDGFEEVTALLLSDPTRLFSDFKS